MFFTRKVVPIRFLLVLGLCILLTAVTPAQSSSQVWHEWTEPDLRLLGGDNTGSTFALETIDSQIVLQVTPGGSSDETKLAYPISGEELQVWLGSNRVQIEVYLPESNSLNANAFFLGLGNVTSGWNWVGGVFGTANGSAGWITVTYAPGTVINQINPDGSYMLYLSFFSQTGGGSKVTLTEPFYLGAIHILSPDAMQQSAVDSPFTQEVEQLLTLDDQQLIEAVARETFDYFWLEANSETGLVKDRSTPDSVSSIAATGFALAALPIGIDRGWISYEEGYERARITLESFINGEVQGRNGFFYHFVDMQTGERAWNSELSSIDTGLLVAGALVSGQYFAGTEVQSLANQVYANVEWDWMLAGGDLLRMGWLPEREFLQATWDHFDESLILYVLAIGSPTHPIPASAWDLWRRPVRLTGEYIYLPGEPLFVYQYPQAFLALRGLEDAYANYWNNTVRACERSYQFAADSAVHYRTYSNGVWGISASDGPSGYRAYGASEVNHDGTIAPYASVSCLPFTPEIALSGMRALLTEFGANVWREYGFVSAINADQNWYSVDHIGIDQGDILLMLANAQDGFVWELFMANQPIQTGLDRMGFIESSGEYAITPAYLARVKGQ
jgi:hypothetical protein